MRRLPTAAEMQVAAVTAASGMPLSWRIDGFTKMMYAIVMKVVNPARISVRQSALRELNGVADLVDGKSGNRVRGCRVRLSEHDAGYREAALVSGRDFDELHDRAEPIGETVGDERSNLVCTRAGEREAFREYEAILFQ